jgi:hypothetical protein
MLDADVITDDSIELRNFARVVQTGGSLFLGMRHNTLGVNFDSRVPCDIV